MHHHDDKQTRYPPVMKEPRLAIIYRGGTDKNRSSFTLYTVSFIT